MKNKKLTICGLAASLLLGLAVTSFAGMVIPNDTSTEAGNWKFEFDAPLTKADIAATNYQYDETYMALVATEAGNWKHEFDAPQTKADIAAINYQYDETNMALVATEAGQNPIGVRIHGGIRGIQPFGTTPEQVVDKDSLSTEGICNRC